jgi:glycosyltransferase involved in cell wall biosynthesis
MPIQRIIVIAPPLLLPSYRARWLRLANNSPQKPEVLCFIPQKRDAPEYKLNLKAESDCVIDGKFKLRVVEVTSNDYHDYLIKNFRSLIEGFKPNLIFCVHHEGIRQLIQCIIIRKLFFRKTRLIYFSMTAFPRLPKMKGVTVKELLKRAYFYLNWWLIRHGTDAALCHYDRIEKQMREEGYKKPILQQTQYGVNPEQFCMINEAREQLRLKIGLNGVVVGFCGRFTPEKGLYELMAAFERQKGDCSLLLIGDGPMLEEIESWIEKNDFQERVHLPGYVPHDEVQAYFRVMDIFVLGSKETPTYIDTFPLVVAQAMTMGLPVVGSISGAIPYQLGGKGLLFPEGDAECLQQHLEHLIQESDARQLMGAALRERALEHFCIDAMNERFIEFVEHEVGA